MSVADLWWLSLAIGAVVVLVVALLLGLIISAAKSIDRQAAGIWTIGKQIAGNTVTIWLLEKTHRHVESMHDSVKALERSVSGLDETMQALNRTAGSEPK